MSRKTKTTGKGWKFAKAKLKQIKKAKKRFVEIYPDYGYSKYDDMSWGDLYDG